MLGSGMTQAPGPDNHTRHKRLGLAAMLEPYNLGL